jgi:hypothetical protein
MQRNNAQVPGGILDQAPPAAQLDQPAATPQDMAPTDRQRIASSKPRSTSRPLGGLYDKAGMTLALVASLAVAALLWFAGAWFTLWFLERAGLALAGAGAARWLIPAALTAGQLWLWPRANSPWQSLIVFLGFLGFDVGTSWGGFTSWGAGRRVELFNGFTIPQGGPWLHGLALVLGLSFAFLPEKIARWALGELRRVWR